MELEELYKNISGEYDLPDFPTFQKDMQDPEKLGRLHKTLQADNYEVPDFQTFQRDMFPEKKKPEAGLEGSSQEQGTVSPVTPKYDSVFKANQGKQWVERVFNPGKYPSLKQPDGSSATHKLAFAEDGGKFYVFPTIQYDPKTKKLTDYSDSEKYGWKPLDDAIKSGEAIEFKTEQEAKEFSEGYKEGTPMDSKFKGTVSGGIETPPNQFQTQSYAAGSPEEVAGQERVAQIELATKKRNQTIADVSFGLDRLATSAKVNPSSWKKQLETVLSDQKWGKTQEERDVKALQLAYGLYDSFGVKRGEDKTRSGMDEGYYDTQDDLNSTWKALGQAEADLREKDPVQWQKMMNTESDDYYKSRGISDGDSRSMEKAIDNKLTGFVEGGLMEKEASLRLQAKDAFRMIAKVDEKFGTEVDDPERREMQAKANGLLKQAGQLKAERHKESIQAISDLKHMIDDPTIGQFQLKAAREKLRLLEQQERGFIDPSYQIQAATEANKEELSTVDGKTPMEKLQRYYSSLLQEERRLWGRIGKDATAMEFVTRELANVVPGGGLVGDGWGPDEIRYKQVREKIRSLSPIVFLNEATDVNGNLITGKEAGEGAGGAGYRNFKEIMTGGGGVMAGLSSLESPQSRAGDITEAMLVAGLDPERAVSINYKQAIDKNAQGYGLGDPQYWLEQGGMVTGILVQSAPGIMLTEGLGANALIARMGNVMQKSPRAAKAVKALMNATKRGVEFEVSGQLSPNQKDELNFASGLLGGFGESAGRGILKGGEKLLGKLFGDKASQAYGLIARYGADKTALGQVGAIAQGRAAMGVGESFGESVESIVHAWQQSEPGHGFWQGMEEEFGKTFDDRLKFFVSTFMLGMALGGGHEGGIASGLMESARAQYEAASAEEQQQMNEFLEDTGSGIEEAHTEAIDSIEEGREPEAIGTDESKPAMEMTPEAQAAQAEMERLRKTREAVSGSGEISQTDSQGKSEADYVEGLTREDVRQLEERLKRTDLTEQERANAERDLNQRKMALDGFEQMRNQTAFREVVPAVEAETETANGGKETPTNTVEIEGVQIELPTIPGTQTPVQQTTETVSGEVVPPAGPVVETPAQEAPKRRDQEIADQINEFFSNLAGTIGANAAEKIKEYADRIIANPENRETILQGQTEKSIEMINKAVELQLNQTKSQEVDGEVDAKKSLADWAHSDSNRNRDSQKVRGKFKNHVIGKWIDKLGNIYQGVKRGKTPDTYIFQDVETGEEVELAADEVVPFMSEDYEAHTKSKQQIVETPAAGIETPTTQQVTAPPQTQQGSPAIDVGTAMDVGLQVAERLAENGLYTRENWNRAMQTYGEAMAPHLERAWEFTSRRIKEGTVKKSKETKKKSGERGTYATIEQYSDANPDSVNQAIATVDRSYQRMNLGELFDEAAQAIKAAGGYIKGYASILEESIDNAGLQMQQAKRFLAVRFFGEYADQLQKDIDQETDPVKKEELTKLRDKAVQMLDSVMQRAAESNTWMGQATAATAQWRFLLENTAGYSRAAIDRYNKALMNETSSSGELTTRAKKKRAKKKEITNSMDESIDGIGESSAVDSVASDIVEERDVKPKERKPSAKKTGLGMTRSQIDEMKAKALEDLRKAARSGMAGALGTTAVFDFMDAAGRYGVALMAEGVVTFKEWSSRMKADIPELTDAQAREAWENQRHEGKTLAELAKEEIQDAATPRTRTAAQKETLRSRIKKTINNHFKKDAAPMTLEQRLVDEVGLTPEEAAYVTEAVQGELQKRMDARIKQKAKALKRKPAQTDRAKPKSDTQRAVEAMVDGELTDQMVQEIFADRLGLQRQLTPEEMAKARALGKALAATTPNTRSEAVAALALDRFMWQVLPAPGMLEQFWEIFKSIVYANMLMGIPTHMKNVMSAGAMTVYGLVEPIANMSKWKRSMREAWKAKDGERLRTLLRSSPFTEMAVKFTALGRGWAKGARIAWDIMKTGFLDSKYIDKQQVRKKAGEPSALGRLSPMLERMKFRGIMYPANIFKYVGRALSAEDAWMTAINLEMELADAVRRHSIESDKRGFAALTRDVNRRMAKSNPDYSDALKEATEQIDEISSALEMTAFERDQAIKIRAREILVDKLKLTEAERQQAEDIARSRVFTLTRGGVWGKTADLMKKINSMKGIGLVSWIWMPFTTIIGNLGDTFNDFFPIYGVLRANGISPTALAQSLAMSKSSAMMGDRLEGTTGERAVQMLGGRQDQRYYEQMGRAWFGAISLLAAFMLMDDDEDDFIRFSGKDDPHHKNFIFIGGYPIVSWELIPPIAPVAAIVSEANSYHKRHPKEERSIAGRILYAMGSVEQSVAGLSVAESAQNLNQVVGTALSSLTGVGNYGDPVDLSKGIQNVAKELGKSGIDMLGRVNPLRNPIVGQIQQIFDPRAYSHSDILQSLEYAALGVIYRYTNDKEGNPKMAMVDIFGEEVERMPAEDAIGFLDRFKNDKSKDSRWKFLVDHGVADKLSRPQNTTLLFADPDDEFGVVAEKMSDFEYGTYARIAGGIFSQKLKDYMADEDQWKQDYEKVEVTKTGTRTELEKYILKIMSESRTEAKDEMDELPASKGGFKNTRL